MKLVKMSIAILGAGFMVLTSAAQAFSLELTYDKSYGSPGFGPGELFVPQGITVDSQGNILVSNGRGVNPDGTPNYNIGNKVEVFSPSGNYLGAIGSGGTGPGQFDAPTVPEFSPQTGDLYVGDVYNSRISQLILRVTLLDPLDRLPVSYQVDFSLDPLVRHSTKLAIFM